MVSGGPRDILDDLEFLGYHWGTAYLTGREGDQFTAERRDGKGGTLTDPERDGLCRKIAADYTASPVPRDLP
jgi:hypothetical protein